MTRKGAALTVIRTSALPMGRHAWRVALAPSRRENRPTGAAQQQRRASGDRAAKLPRVDWLVFGRSQGLRLSRFRCPEGLTAHRSGRPNGGRLPMQRRGPYEDATESSSGLGPSLPAKLYRLLNAIL